MKKEDKINRAIIYIGIFTVLILYVPYIYSELRGYTLSQIISIYNTYGVLFLAAAVLGEGILISIFLYGSRPLQSTYLKYLKIYFKDMILGAVLGTLLFLGFTALGSACIK